MGKRRNDEINMTEGPLAASLLGYAVPLTVSGILQQLFNVADMAVVGRFAGKQSLAAVGSTSPVVNLIILLFMGMATGANIIIGQYLGAGKEDKIKVTVHTTIGFSVIAGIGISILGMLFSRRILFWMKTPDDVIDLATLYLQIYFLGMPASLAYNYGSAIFRANGDTKRPLKFLTISGFVNVGLNMLFVILFRMGVGGVALATIISQYLSAVLLIRYMCAMDHVCRLNLKDLRIDKEQLGLIVKTGLPEGIQGAVFCLSSILIQSAINSFGSTVMAAASAVSSLSSFLHTVVNAFKQASLSFTSRNYGAGNYDRIMKITKTNLLLVVLVVELLGCGAVFFGQQLLGIYTTDAQIIACGQQIMRWMFYFYGMCGVMEVLEGAIRGMGHAMEPMILSIIGACAFRSLWLITLFAWVPTIDVLYASYPASWVIVITMDSICLMHIWKKEKKRSLS